MADRDHHHRRRGRSAAAGRGDADHASRRATASRSVLDGASLFQSKGCATCHDGPTSTSMIGGFPSLADAPSWAADRRAPMSAADYIAESIRTPSAFTSPAFSGGVGPTDGMPDLRLTQPEIDALVTYLLQG